MEYNLFILARRGSRKGDMRFLLFLLIGVQCFGHPLDEGRQRVSIQLKPMMEALEIQLSVEFDPEVSELLLSAYDVDVDGTFSEEEQATYSLANLELALDLVEVSAGRLETYYTLHRQLPKGLLFSSDLDQNGKLDGSEYFGIVRERAPEQYYLFNDRVGSTDFLLSATNAQVRLAVAGEGKWRSVQVQVSSQYTWPDRIPMGEPFGCKVNLAYRSMNIASHFSILPGLDGGLEVLDQLHVREKAVAESVDWKSMTPERFQTLPKTRRSILLLERRHEPHQILP